MSLRNPTAFFAACRSAELFGSTMFQGQVDGCNHILNACSYAGWPTSWTAYGLTTGFHETAHSMAPRDEIGRGKGHPYGVIDGTGKAPYGRGYVQLTWAANYQKADRILGLGGRLAFNYDVALEPAVASDILIRGMAEGWFTGKKLADYLTRDGEADHEQFRASRKIINGTDRADMIADIALAFQTSLSAAGWSV
jgi:hypothetical protein